MKREGSILLEVVISVGILASLAGSCAIVVVSTLRANSLSKNAIIAQNLAKEGVEVIRGIRDTNWLKYSTEKTVKWDLINNGTEEILSNVTYIPVLDTFTNLYNLEVINEDAFFDIDNVSQAIKDKAKIYLSGSPQVYVNKLEPEISDNFTGFYRVISVECQDNPIDPIIGCQNYFINSKAQWNERGKTMASEISSNIANY